MSHQARFVNISSISDSTETQIRVSMDLDQIEQYVLRMLAGDTFPAIILYRIGGQLIVADGFQRLDAARKAGAKKILATVVEGKSLIDAIAAAIRGNCIHGAKLTKSDREKAVLTYDRFALAEFGKRPSAREVAEIVKCSHTTVNNVRKRQDEINSVIPQSETPLEKLARESRNEPEPDNAVDDGEVNKEPIWLDIATGKEYVKMAKKSARDLRANASEFSGIKSGVMLKKHTNAINRLVDDILAIYAGCEPVGQCDLCKGAGCDSCKQSGVLFAEQAKMIERDKKVSEGE